MFYSRRAVYILSFYSVRIRTIHLICKATRYFCAVKLLIIRFSSIGDIVLTTPVIRCVKKRFPEAEIHFATKQTYASVIESNPHISKLHLLENNNWTSFLASFSDDVFDAVIDLHKNIRTKKLLKHIRYKKADSFNKLNLEKWLFTALKLNFLPSVHIVDRYLQAAAFLGVTNDGEGLDYVIPANEIVDYNDLPTTHHAGFYAWVIGAAHATKRLPKNKLKALAKKLQHPMVLLGGKEDAAMGEEISATDPFKIYNACGKFSLNESADLIRKSRLVITHDTGLMHIAAAFRKPVFSIWGNTVTAFGMTPYYGKHEVFNRIYEVEDLACRPCSKIGYNSCPLGHFNCMELQQIDRLVSDINAFDKK